MTINLKYGEFVDVGNFTFGERDGQLLGGLGLAGESGEVCDIIKKHIFHGKALDRAHLVEELGDVMWYLQHTCNVFGITMEEVLKGNIIKLCDRHSRQYGEAEDWLGENDK